MLQLRPENLPLCGLRDFCVKNKKPKSIYFDRFRSEKIGFDLPTTSNQEILSHQIPQNDFHDLFQYPKMTSRKSPKVIRQAQTSPNKPKQAQTRSNKPRQAQKKSRNKPY